MYRHWIAFHISAMQGACTVVMSTSTVLTSTSTSTSTRNLYSSCTRVRVRVPSTTSLEICDVITVPFTQLSKSDCIVWFVKNQGISRLLFTLTFSLTVLLILAVEIFINVLKLSLPEISYMLWEYSIIMSDVNGLGPLKCSGSILINVIFSCVSRRVNTYSFTACWWHFFCLCALA